MRPIGIWRQVVKEEQKVDSPHVPAVDVQLCYRSWLLSLGGRRIWTALWRNRNQCVSLMSNGSLRTVVRRHRRTAERDFAAVVAALCRNGLLPLHRHTKFAAPVTLGLIDSRGAPLWELPSARWLLGK